MVDPVDLIKGRNLPPAMARCLKYVELMYGPTLNSVALQLQTPEAFATTSMQYLESMPRTPTTFLVVCLLSRYMWQAFGPSPIYEEIVATCLMRIHQHNNSLLQRSMLQHALDESQHTQSYKGYWAAAVFGIGLASLLWWNFKKLN